MANKPPLISAAIRAKLDAARVARLATLDDHQSPHLVPMCFALNENVFYSAIDRKPKRVAPKRLARLRNIKKMPQVALLVDRYEEDWTLLWYVLVRGEAELVSAAAEGRSTRSIVGKCSQRMLSFCASLLNGSPRGATFRLWKSLFKSHSSFLLIGAAERASSRAIARQEQRPDQRKLRERRFSRKP
jgi:PPOX class probable F420-dependent enzyme